MAQAKKGGSGSGSGSGRPRKAGGTKRGGGSAAGRSASGGGRSSSGTGSSRPGRGRSSSSARSRQAASSEARKPSSPPAEATDELRANLAAFSDFVLRGMEGPLHVVMLTNERIQEVMDDAVERGRMTRDDGEALVQEMVRRGRQQTADVLADFERLVERAQDQFGAAAIAARRSPPADRVLREVDRARRTAGLGQPFPILSYEELTTAQVADRLEDLSPAELRKVRDYERRHGNRKSVLQAIESKLG
jgi:polyhydroxyalkanoate synthesis regulator phasin